MTVRTVLMFAGQGSQYHLMGRELYEGHSVFREWLCYCSRFLESRLKLSLVDLLYRERDDRFAVFDETRLTHPAIFALNYAVGQVLLAEGIKPTHFLGYSLGELVAWTMAGAVRLESALNTVAEIGELIEQKTRPGGMLAILAPPETVAHEGTAVASLNYPGNFVVSGEEALVQQLASDLKARSVLCQPLPIRHGFHSALLDPIEGEVKNLFSRLTVQPLERPVISSLLTRAVTAAEFSPQYCWDVLRLPVRFSETIEAIEKEGPCNYIDAGPSGTLAAFVRQIVGRRGPSRSISLLTPFGKDLRALEKLKIEYADPAATRT